ncbi:MAG: hypothetical protein GY737_04820 [Desulfobacteraceae bacterium]|nr:hypothetical protein [Desulfobacteraceae bacterium]
MCATYVREVVGSGRFLSYALLKRLEALLKRSWSVPRNVQKRSEAFLKRS